MRLPNVIRLVRLHSYPSARQTSSKSTSFFYVKISLAFQTLEQTCNCIIHYIAHKFFFLAHSPSIFSSEFLHSFEKCRCMGYNNKLSMEIVLVHVHTKSIIHSGSFFSCSFSFFFFSFLLPLLLHLLFFQTIEIKILTHI